LDFSPQFFIASAGLADKIIALVARQFHRRVENLLDLLPLIFVHGNRLLFRPVR
jgi:hypothetical protein